jgi:hypothetical protein
MALSVSASFQKSLSSLAADESPILAVRICPPPQSAGTRRPYHLALLIDASGSMDGERITAVKRTLHLLVDAMMDDDRLSLIKYESIATTPVSAVCITAETRTTIHAAVDTLYASGGTNMEAAIQQLHSLPSPAADAVFLLTDGHVNQGIASSTGLLRLLAAAVPAGTPVNTLGFGAEHNSRMLRDMSVRSRGSYTYADAAELLPAIIGDIMGGLVSEFGRNAALSIPAGWECMEYGAEAAASSYGIGTLICEKPQWAVLKGPVGTTTPPDITLTWTTEAREERQGVVIGDTISAVEVNEQHLRAKVATTFAQITELLEAYRSEEAKTVLETLGRDLDASVAHDRPFVLQLRAQVDEMLESVVNLLAPPPPPGFHGGLIRAGNMMGPPPMGPMLSRLASNTATLGVQRGYLSQEDPNTNVFSSPGQRHTSRAISANYSQA